MKPYSWSSISVNLGFTSYCTIDRNIVYDNEINNLYN